MSRLNITNATKANLIGAAAALLGIAVYFGLDPELGGLIITAVGALGTLVTSLTYKASPKRLPDGLTQKDGMVVVPAGGPDENYEGLTYE